MELNSNIIGVQGILLQCSKQIGDFTKIKYKGGNEGPLNYLNGELSNFLTSHHLLDQNHVKDLNEVIFFLALNTDFKRQLPDCDEYSHLIGIVPKLSKCLLANVCFELNLVRAYGWVIEKLPLELTEELLDQVIDCLKCSNQKKNISSAFIIISSVVSKLSSTELSYKTENTVDDIVQVITIILQNATCIVADQAKSMKAKHIHQQMGFVLLKLFELLLSLNIDNETVCKLLPLFVSTTCNIVRCVTVDVFCSWAEIDCEDQPLQAVIAENAYAIVEKYQKNKLSSELVSMLSSIARKPKTIAERIREADLATIVKMVDEKNEHQSLWFRALLNTNALSDLKVIECIERWWEFSDDNDLKKLVILLLARGTEHKRLIIKIGAKLPLESIATVLASYLYQETIYWQDNIANELVLVFNQVHDNMNESELKQCLVLLLRNPRDFYRSLYAAAFKRSPEFSQIFSLIKDMSTGDGLSLKTFWEVLDVNVPSVQNVANYVQLFHTLVNSGYFTWEFMVLKVILPLLDKFNCDGSLEEFKNCINVLKHFHDQKCDLSTDILLFEYLLATAAQYRCKSFLKFDPAKAEVTSCCVDFILHKCHHDFHTLQGKNESFPRLGSELDDPWSNYFKQLFWNSGDELSFLDSIIPGLDLSNYKAGEVNEQFTRVLKVLPRCVAAEWKILLSELTARNGFNTSSNAVTDILTLLCDFGETRCRNSMASDADKASLEALKYCLHNYGAFLLSTPHSKEHQFLAVHNLCRVLKHIPSPLKETEGLCLINGIPEGALKSMSEDKEFVARIILIDDKQLCKALAQKVIAVAQIKH